MSEITNLQYKEQQATALIQQLQQQLTQQQQQLTQQQQVIQQQQQQLTQQQQHQVAQPLKQLIIPQPAECMCALCVQVLCEAALVCVLWCNSIFHIT